MTLHDEMTKAMNDYCRKAGIKITTLSNYVLGDGKGLPRIAAGDGCTMKMYERVMKWMAENPPKMRGKTSGKPRPLPSQSGR